MPGPSDTLPLVLYLSPLSQDAFAGCDSFAQVQKENVDFDRNFDQGEEGELGNVWMGSLSWDMATKIEKVRTNKKKK